MTTNRIAEIQARLVEAARQDHYPEMFPGRRMGCACGTPGCAYLAALATFDAVDEEDPSRSMKERQRIEENGA